MAESIEQLSFELTAHALAEQGRALAGLRTRAGTVLAAASIAGALLAAKTSHGSLDAWSVLGMISFVACVASAIWILVPHELVFAFRGDALLAESDHHGVRDVIEAYRAAGIWIEPHLEGNRSKIASPGQAKPMATKPSPAAVAPAPQPPAQLPATAPPGFAIPEKRGGLFGRAK